MINITALKSRNAERWAAMHVNSNRIAEFDRAAHEYCKPENKVRFQAVTNALVRLGYQAVPWWFIAIVSEREYGRNADGSLRWDRQLGQGDHLHSVSTHEPSGRGPFLDHPGDDINNNAWLRCCLDALINCAPFAAKWTDWSIGGTLTIWEEYNGLGYASMGVPSAYVFSGSDQYVSGKYIVDHVYRASAVDVQEGCAPLLARMMAIDSSIVIGEVPVQPKKEPVMPPTTTPTTVPVVPGFHINFAEIEAGIEAVAKFLPIIGAFLPPQFKPILAVVPIAEGILKMIADIQTASQAGAPSGDVANVVAAHLHSIGDNIREFITHNKLPVSLNVAAGPSSMTPAQIIAGIQASVPTQPGSSQALQG